MKEKAIREPKPKKELKNSQSKLLTDVLNLTKKPQLKKPTRTEPTLEISEFGLVKSITGKQGVVHVNDLTKVLKKRAKHVEIGKKVKSAQNKTKTLPKPLEKPKADRIRRSAAFEGVKKQLRRWDAVVTSNRASNHLTFPLPPANLENEKKTSQFRLKSDLQKELEELEPKVDVEVFNLEEEPKYPLTMQEMLERRKEMAKMRAVQSYKEAKARRQSKIKSKKYHRIQRREKIKQQMKEFEKLQTTNPEEALKKLEEIEKVRAMERASLRHRSTGKWAKNKQVQAKYDKESRQVLAQQLALSRDLTQKIQVTNESESEEEVQNGPKSAVSEENPWTNVNKTPDEIEEFVSGYRKFWENKNKELKNKKQSDDSSENDTPTPSNKSENSEDSDLRKTDSTSDVKKKNVETAKNLQNNSQKKNAQNNLRLQRNKYIVQVGTSDWEVGSISSESDDNNNGDNSEEDKPAVITNNVSKKQEGLKEKLKTKYNKLLRELKKEEELDKRANKKTKKRKLKQTTDNFSALQIKVAPRHPVIKEQLLESADGDTFSNDKDGLDALEAVLKRGSNKANKKRDLPTKNATDIDPNDIIKVKPVNLNTDVPDLLTVDLEDDEENTDQNADILEAFQDDDLVEEFKKDKESEADKEKPQDINLALPGWGSWGGTGIKPSKRKQKRFIVKFPKKVKRRDDNKGDLIINEKAAAKIKPHLVSEVPFPFKKAKDFEASIRAPIGNTFVPETAYRKMIRPAVVTKMGRIIKPMTDDILLKKKK